MRNLLSLSLMVLILSCASLSDVVVPELSKRTLRISTRVPGFEYQWSVCVKKNWLGGCREYQMKVETYDLRDEAVRDKLIAMGFVAKVREPVTP